MIDQSQTKAHAELTSLIKSIEWTSINSFDMGILLILLFSITFAIFRGFIPSALSLIGWILSFFLTQKVYETAKPMLVKHMSVFTSAVMGYFLTFIILLTLFSILNFILSSMLRNFCNGAWGKILAGIFGFFRGIFITSVLLLCLSSVLSVFVQLNEEDDHASNENAGNINRIAEDDNGILVNINKFGTNTPSFIKNSHFYPTLYFITDNTLRLLPVDITTNISASTKKKEKKSIAHKKQKSNKTEAKKEAIEKLKKYADKTTMQNIESKIEENLKDNSESDNIQETLNMLLQHYNNALGTGEIPPGKALSNQDYNEIQSLTKSSQN